MKYKPYSFSKISVFNQCPFKFELSYIKKIKCFSYSEALEKGSYVHKLLEDYVKKEKTSFNFNLLDENKQKEAYAIFENTLPYLENKMKAAVKTETELDFKISILKDKDKYIPYSVNERKLSLFLGSIDLVLYEYDKITVIDWKTGKVPEKPNSLQMLMYVIAIFALTRVDTVDTIFYYVEHSVEKPFTFFRKDLQKLIKKLLEKIHAIEVEKEFNRKESPLCNFCDYRKEGYCNELDANEFIESLNKTLSKINKTK
jgi:RecB family exonuclease